MSDSDILPAPVLDLPRPPDHKWQREHEAFLRMLPQLLTTYRNQYVAIHEGKVVSSGPDLVEVGMKAYEKFGYVPMYIDLVTERPLPPVRVPSPRLVGNERTS